ncbi:Uncharacterised protein [Moraxella lacunata]|uniref:Uncharacterized protein n=1 Tax=Moraxella lacunata TaxID=477 RepID=A0A1V4GL84_MORLA|nr:hypothetical protein [Moraxella lacunata]OPH33091.1 hypothetical protein B5J94_13750 [Moraxella lacunata]STY99190.1 Uncharacterised protein [Moraxella lacunata]
MPNTPSNSRVPISVRISQEDADFIASLQIQGANTPSDKIRELLRQARTLHTQGQDYETSLSLAEQQLYTARHEILALEKELSVHSHIVARIFEILPDLVATMMADYPKTCDKSALVNFEKQAMWRVVRLMDSVLQLAVTGKGAGYDDSVLDELDNTLQLANLIYQHTQTNTQPIRKKP